jgi:energy-converting hydrogenase Eha subunit A
MGSSTLMMCSFLVSLILSIIAASVVDLPLPVGPVTSTRPRGFSVMSSTALGRPSL